MIRVAFTIALLACGLVVGGAAENLVSGAVETRTAIIEDMAQ